MPKSQTKSAILTEFGQQNGEPYLDVSVDKIVGTDTKAVEVARVHEQQSVRFRAPGVVVELERQVRAKVIPRSLTRAERLRERSK
jgi:homoserine dehydrogenase